jgi:hypothetical protein
MSGRLPALLLILALPAVLPAAGERPAREGDRTHWAFRTLARPPVPAVQDGGRVRTAVDAYVLAGLEARGLTFAPEADRRTLVRRLALDLTGLPPAPEEVEAFCADARPDAYESLVDRLLASPHFGERWGRHWLDNAGYVDVTGGDNDAATVKLGASKWRYRDWVIDAFNADLPFDRFLTEQLAGDELLDWRAARSFTPEMRRLLVATGFLRVSADDTDENELNTLDIRHGVLQRTGEILAGNLLGLTLNCARCHDHKYEPLTQRDYYRWLALLQPAFNPDAWLQPKARLLPAVPAAEKAAIDKLNADIDRHVADLARQIETLRKKGAAQTAADKARAADLERQAAECKARRRGWDTLQAVYDTGPPGPTHLLLRGNHLRPGPEVPPGFPTVLGGGEPGDSKPAGASSGRRLALAKWLTDWRSPAGALVLRVRVNRVWAHLFGKGLVETTDNLGLTGARPTHPELLEWLAGTYASEGGRLKPLLRVLVTSSVYRQSSRTEDTAARRVDPDNRLLGRMRLRRLESEAVRDSLLAVSGRLDRTAGGPPVAVDPRPDGSFVVRDGSGANRRSLYLLARRNYHPTILGVFDQPVLTTQCTGRTPSAVVLQPLTMLNDPFVRTQAEALAGRLAPAAPAGSPEGLIDAAFRTVLGRPPRPAETAWCADFLRQQETEDRARGLAPAQASRQGVNHLAHVLLNTSEFLYVP